MSHAVTRYINHIYPLQKATQRQLKGKEREADRGLGRFVHIVINSRRICIYRRPSSFI